MDCPLLRPTFDHTVLEQWRVRAASDTPVLRELALPLGIALVIWYNGLDWHWEAVCRVTPKGILDPVGDDPLPDATLDLDGLDETLRYHAVWTPRAGSYQHRCQLVPVKGKLPKNWDQACDRLRKRGTLYIYESVGHMDLMARTTRLTALQPHTANQRWSSPLNHLGHGQPGGYPVSLGSAIPHLSRLRQRSDKRVMQVSAAPAAPLYYSGQTLLALDVGLQTHYAMAPQLESA